MKSQQLTFAKNVFFHAQRWMDGIDLAALASNSKAIKRIWFKNGINKNSLVVATNHALSQNANRINNK